MYHASKSFDRSEGHESTSEIQLTTVRPLSLIAILAFTLGRESSVSSATFDIESPTSRRVLIAQLFDTLRAVGVAILNASQLQGFVRNEEEPSFVAPSAILNCPSRRFVALLSFLRSLRPQVLLSPFNSRRQPSSRLDGWRDDRPLRRVVLYTF